MGIINIDLQGSFPQEHASFSAMKHGHAAAVAKAIQWLAEFILPRAIKQDHELQEKGFFPEDTFGE